MSKIQKETIAMARVLLGNPKILLINTSGFDNLYNFEDPNSKSIKYMINNSTSIFMPHYS